ncbi:single-stranded DNA-binding protein [Pseudonocardiaceae bacterium YIM PH 21723]|nr:single-stranded DNA-binding protein [Pseudonocardiaceae bacterium YIM PH 21723]
MYETSVTLVGRITGEVDHRMLPDGTELAKFRMVSTSRRYDRQRDQWVDGDSLYVNVDCWKRLADGVARTLHKGDPVVVTGQLTVHEFEWEGAKRKELQVRARSVGPDLQFWREQSQSGGEVVNLRDKALRDEGVPAVLEPRLGLHSVS